MTEYEKMARRSRPRAARQQMAETQRQFVRGVLFLIGVTLLIIFKPVFFSDEFFPVLSKLGNMYLDLFSFLFEFVKLEEPMITKNKND